MRLRAYRLRRPPNGAMAQLVAHLLCKQGVTGSSPVGSTTKNRPTTRPFSSEPARRWPPRMRSGRIDPYLTPVHAPNSSPKRSAAPRCTFSEPSTYSSLVITGVECPSTSWMFSIGTPSSYSSVAHECRRSWNRIRRTPRRRAQLREGLVHVRRLKQRTRRRREHQPRLDPAIPRRSALHVLALAMLRNAWTHGRGKATNRIEPSVFTGPSRSPPPARCNAWRTRTTARSKSTSAQARPSTSPRRMPVISANA